MYSIITKGQLNVRKAKGVEAHVLKNEISHNDYRRFIEDVEEAFYRNQNSIRSRRYNVFTINQRKLVLSGNDDKRCILLDNMKTLPWGYRQIVD